MAKHEEEKGGKKPKKHLHEIRTEETEDGHFIHHHSYKEKRGDSHPSEERRNVAVSNSPEEAGQHTEEQFGMNEPPEGQEQPEPAEGGGEEAGEQPGGAQAATAAE